MAEVLTARSAAGGGATWAMAGRSAGKLAAVRRAIGAPVGVALIEVDATDPAALAALAAVRGDRDPGYGATSKRIIEVALCPGAESGRDHTPGGVWTAGAAIGLALVRRVVAHAGLTFKLID